MRPNAIQPAEQEDEVNGDKHKIRHAAAVPLVAAADKGSGSAGQV